MKDSFYLYFDEMPKGTAQQKGYNKKTGVYFKKEKVVTAAKEFTKALKPHRPKKPAELPVKLSVYFYFDVKSKNLWGKPKATRPDTDNYIKEFKDCMTKLGFWKDDAQVVDEHIKKFYAEKATIVVIWEEIGGTT